MIGPRSDVDASVFTLRNSGGKEVRFKGWQLAMVSNFNPGLSRWKERAVYQTKAGKIVCHMLGCSRMPGEVDRGKVLVVDASPTADQQVVEFFGDDSLAKDLLSALQIDNYQWID